MLWLVLVRIPPAMALTDVIVKTTNESKFFFITFKLILLKTAAKVSVLHKRAFKVHKELTHIN
jgi:hypothetical protein